MRISILGVAVDAVTRAEAHARVEAMLDEPRAHLVTTPNPEMVVLAQKDEEFRSILNSADLAIPDGVGLLVAAKMLGEPLKERIPGVEFLIELCRIGAARGERIFFLGGAEGVGSAASGILVKHVPKLHVAGVAGGIIERVRKGEWVMEEHVLHSIRGLNPTILIVALGHSKQEKWIADHIHELPTVRLAIGVGGALDFISGLKRRAPHWMRKIGLEWLYRLVSEPRRFRRVMNALLVFPWLVIRRKK